MHVFWSVSTWDARFCMFLHVFAHCMYLRYTNTCYKVLTFSCTNFKILNTVLHSTDLMMHDFKLHEFFSFPQKRASQGLTVCFYRKTILSLKIFIWIHSSDAAGIQEPLWSFYYQAVSVFYTRFQEFRYVLIKILAKALYLTCFRLFRFVNFLSAVKKFYPCHQ